MLPSENLSGKLRWVFIRQALVASLLFVAGIALTSLVLQDALLKQRVQLEVDHAWDMVARNADKPLPHGAELETYFVPVGKSAAHVPAELRALSPGTHRMASPWRQVYVSERAAGRVYIRIAPGTSDRLVLWLSLLCSVVSIIGIAILSWLGYRRSRRVVAPVTQLAQVARHWQPDASRGSAFRMSAGTSANTPEVVCLAEALDGMAARVASYVERERNFTRDASHELRTPLTVIAVAADLLAAGQLDARSRKSVERIRAASRGMGELLDALLILARHPDEPVEKDWVDVRDIIHEEVALARPCLADKPVALQIDAPCGLQLEAPPRVIATILSQLLRNACRFTRQGYIEVSLRADALHVRDTGIGMDADALARVFDPFWRADISDHTVKGMGLTLSRRLAEHFGWQLVLDSQPGEGTVASLYFHPCVNP
ncbi:two-component sensor histidine kinase [Lysobacteraceae bacterium NML120232]|nr:two-component sensor histidine kinase [Xanthomonadaceae bacterium NML08-0793]PJK09766.1 two-component sensor histidine kinase [Xanthomonadaceae bacterium NML120232]